MMKPRFALYSVLFSLCAAIQAQGASWALPPGQDPFRFISREEATSEPDRDVNLYGFPVFRLWGWSRDGKIAYSVERSIEGRGGEVITYYIQDLVTDEMVWQFEDDSYNWENYNPQIDGSVGNHSFSHHSAALARKLRDSGIKGDTGAYAEFPARISGRKYDCAATTAGKADGSPGDAVREYRVTVRRDGTGEKTIKTETNVRALAVYVCGWFKSPFEERIAVVTAEERFVFEGTELFYSLSGCSLLAGFR